ncbi:hypothetical protein SSX86_012092 [Deinandra increscens subsp. villosa]|uniref:MBD domain-containing protein n=1 Tax=Deinandra increscens subsp. villosa TaxID=3103831 RepID=A0AAP0H089_9ASTR
MQKNNSRSYVQVRRVYTPVNSSDGSRSCISSYSNHPNYMAKTKSSKAKVRSLSAPRIRPQVEVSSATKRVSGKQQVLTTHDSFVKKTYNSGSSRIDQLGLHVYNTEENQRHTFLALLTPSPYKNASRRRRRQIPPEMGPDDWPDWLPTDWTVNIRNIDGRTVKCYLHPEGQKCYSKPEVLDCLKKLNGNTANEKTKNVNDSTVDLPVDRDASLPEGRPTKLTPRTSRRKSHTRDLSEDALAGVGSSSERLSSRRHSLSSRRHSGDTNWLPEGWTVEVKVRKGGSSSGMKYKLYTDPISGQKFFSKPQVLNHLAKTNSSANGEKEELSQPITPTPISVWQEKSPTEPDNTQTFEATEVKKNRTRKKTEGVRSSSFSDYEVISRTPVAGLPAGWIKEVRVRKHGSAKRKDPYYLDPLSEYTFFSKKDALRYLDSGDVRACVMKPIRRDVNKDDTRNVNLTSGKEDLTSPDPSKGTETPKELPNGFLEELKKNESDTQNQNPARSISGGSLNITSEENSDWLPDGWITEVHYKKSGAKYKIYKEAASGKKLFSKPQVLSYLAGGSSSNSRKRKKKKGGIQSTDLSPNPTPADATHPKRSTKKKGDIQSADCQEVITTSPADGLPPGWIKEVRTKIYATHKRNDPFYTDPVSGYIFRSRLDALRYLESGDVNLCAMRPKVKDKDGNEVYVYTHGEQKPVKPTTGKRLFEDKEDDPSTENHTPKTTDNTKSKASVKVTKNNNPTTASGARSSKRKKGMDPGTSGGATEGNGAAQVKQATWVNLEKEPADDGNLSYDLPEDDTWTDQCIDFAVKTLANEILYNGTETAGANETPTKVN